MISPNALAAWRASHPWADDDQVEQDLIMTRVAAEIADHPELGGRLVWRGGTCLHKLFLPAPLRYSEDLDYVAYDLSIEDNDMRTLRAGLRQVAASVGLEVAARAKTTSSRLTEHLTYTSVSGVARRIKVEVNLDEVPAIEPLDRRSLGADTDWWAGAAEVLTFQPVELIATKFRALAQRRKGRDLNDLNIAYRELVLDDDRLGRAAAYYLFHAGVHANEFRRRLAAHLGAPDFVSDVATYLVDPTAAGDPAGLVNHWIRWTDRHLDLSYARLAAEAAPGKRKEQTIFAIEERLADGTEQCPVHDPHEPGWRRCVQSLDGDTCPDHGPLA